MVTKIFDRKRVVLCLCDIVEPVQHLDKTGKGQIAIDTARRWCRGEATLKEVKAAAAAAFAAAAAVAFAVAAPDVAFADAVAAVAFAVDASTESLKRSADIVRKHFPWSEVKELLEED